MQNGFSLKLLRLNSDEGILIVLLKYKKKTIELYANILSFNRFNDLEKELLITNQKYFYKKNMLVVHDLSEFNLRNIIKEMEISGDLFDIMQPLSNLNKLQLQWLIFKKRFSDILKF